MQLIARRSIKYHKTEKPPGLNFRNSSRDEERLQVVFLFHSNDADAIPLDGMRPFVLVEMIGRGFAYRVASMSCGSLVDIHMALLRRLWTDFPDRRNAMAAAMRSCMV